MTDAVPIEEYYDLTRITEFALSPDGERVAFVATEFDRGDEESRRSLFVAPTDGSDRPHRLTRTADASDPRWSPDGTKLGFVAAREEDIELALVDDADAGGDDDEGTDDGDAESDSEGAADEPDAQLWVFDLSRGGDARQVTAFDEGIAEFDWAPGGDRAVVAARDPTDEQREYLDRREEGGPIETERLQHKFDGAGWLDTVRTYLFVVDCESREATRLDDAFGGGAVADSGGLQPRWSPDGDRIAFRSNRTENPDDTYVTDLYTITPSGSALRKLTDSTLQIGRPAWHAEGDRLAFVGSDPRNWYAPSEVHVADLADESYRSLTPEFDRTVARFGSPRWDDDEVVAAFADEGWTRLVRIPLDGDPERTFEAQGRDRGLRGFDLRGGTVALLSSHPQEGQDVHVVDVAALDGGAGAGGSASESGEATEASGAEEAEEPNGSGDASPLRRITAVNDDRLEEWATPTCRRIGYESDGREIEALAYLPPEFDPESPDPHPTVLSIHGGPMSYDQPAFEFDDLIWTSRGYVVCKPNYRGSTSYGRDHCEAIRGRWGTDEVADLEAALDELEARGWTDPDRTFSTGFSYGGIATGYLVTRTDRFAAAAAEHGIYDLRSSFGTDDCHVWWENEYGLPWEDGDAYEASSSITDVGAVETPLLVTAGENDWRCPPSQSEQLYVSVKKRGVPARFVVYPDEHHDIGDPDRAVHRLEELTDWFDRFDPAGDGD